MNLSNVTRRCHMESVLSLAGRSGQPFTIPLEHGKTAEFARAVSLAAGPAPDDSLTPITFLVSSRLWCPPESSAWHGIERDYRRVLHGAQEFEFPIGPPPAGISLVGTELIERAYEKTGSAGRLGFTDTATTFRDPGADEPRAVMRATSITLAEPRPPARDDRPRDDWAAPAEFALTHELIDEPLTITRFVRYQGASGDFNPIHHDPAFAGAAGYPSPISIGMLAAGLAATLLTSQADASRLRRYRTRWLAPAWPGDRLRYRLFVADRPSLTAMIEVARECGQTHMIATADLEGTQWPAR
jgi:acyl dehydratase